MVKFIVAFFIGLILFSQDSMGVTGPLFTLGGLALLIWSGWNIIKRLFGKDQDSAKGIPDQVKDLKFKHFHGKTGIAIDTANREVHLKDGPNYRVYGFDQVRSWETKFQAGGQVYGGGLNGLAVNLANARSNAENTGLFIKVKDVEFPEWKVDFPGRAAKKELTRWMEILQQTLNEAVA